MDSSSNQYTTGYPTNHPYNEHKLTGQASTSLITGYHSSDEGRDETIASNQLLIWCSSTDEWSLSSIVILSPLWAPDIFINLIVLPLILFKVSTWVRTRFGLLTILLAHDMVGLRYGDWGSAGIAAVHARLVWCSQEVELAWDHVTDTWCRRVAGLPWLR